MKLPALVTVGNRRVTSSAVGISQKDVSLSLDSGQSQVLYLTLLFTSMTFYRYELTLTSHLPALSNVAIAQPQVLCEGRVNTNWPDGEGVGTPATAQWDPAPVPAFWAKSSPLQSSSSKFAWL